MQVETLRFGTISIDATDLIEFPQALWGFPEEHGFVLLRRRPDSKIGWLQSTRTPNLALPVVSTDALELDPLWWRTAAPQIAKVVTEGSDPHALLAVLAIRPDGSATVNLLAPIVVNAKTRQGAQVVLEKAPFTTSEPFVPAPMATASASASAPAEQAAASL